MAFGRFPSAELMLAILTIKGIIQVVRVLQSFRMLHINLRLFGQLALLLKDSRRHVGFLLCHG